MSCIRLRSPLPLCVNTINDVIRCALPILNVCSCFHVLWIEVIVHLFVLLSINNIFKNDILRCESFMHIDSFVFSRAVVFKLLSVMIYTLPLHVLHHTCRHSYQLLCCQPKELIQPSINVNTFVFVSFSWSIIEPFTITLKVDPSFNACWYYYLNINSDMIFLFSRKLCKSCLK